MIPKVKTWRLTFQDNSMLEVYAPNKALAKLALRDHPKFWGKGLVKIGMIRARK